MTGFVRGSLFAEEMIAMKKVAFSPFFLPKVIQQSVRDDKMDLGPFRPYLLTERPSSLLSFRYTGIIPGGTS